ncbi:MAG: Translation initiation factor IF-1 [Parcubacteria group bacterium GW2011_GWF2_38_76]|nr:MAG: Translation initiation factor IF-1 [Parcubacteria group bacterium GW2011_GWF2_38_76]HBM46017.1 translation initiation factor IF-1 [Patescibacteria group bacterium]
MDTNVKNSSSIGEEVEGTVVESLPNTMFRVDIGNNKIILTYLSGKMRIHRIKILIGDKVRVQLDSHGERGRIVRRM